MWKSCSDSLQEEALKDLEDLVKKLPWTDPLEVWKLNTSLKKRKTRRKKGNQQSNAKKEKVEDDGGGEGTVDKELHDPAQTTESTEVQDPEKTDDATPPDEDEQYDSKEEFTSCGENENELNDYKKSEVGTQVLKFRVTCNRAGDKHSFKSNEAARDFGGAVQDFFQWKADMTNFDVEVQ